MESRLRRPTQFAFEPEQCVEESDQILLREFIGTRSKRTFFLDAAHDFFLEPEFQDEEIAYTSYEFPDVLLNVQSLIDDDAYIFKQSFRIALGQCVKGP